MTKVRAPPAPPAVGVGLCWHLANRTGRSP